MLEAEPFPGHEFVASRCVSAAIDLFAGRNELLLRLEANLTSGVASHWGGAGASEP
jgi:hypothetical protein